MGEPIHNCFNFTKIMVSRDVDDIEQLSLNSHTTTFLEVFSVCGIFPVLDFHCMWDFPWGTGFVCGFSKFVGFSLCVGFALYVCVIFHLCMWDLACMCLGDLPHVFYMYCPSVHQLYPHRVEVGQPPEDCVCGGADQSDAGQHP